MSHDTHVLILQLSAISCFTLLVLLGLNVWTGYDAELASWILDHLELLRTILVYFNFISACILGCATVNQHCDWEDPLSWPSIVRAQLLLSTFIVFYTTVFTLYMYLFWVLILWPALWLIGTTYRDAVPHKYDAMVEDYCVTVIEVFSLGYMTLSLIIFLI